MIVVALDIVEEFGVGIFKSSKATTLQDLGFDRSDHRFGPRIVVRICPARHALGGFLGSQKRSKITTTILTSSIAMEYCSWLDRLLIIGMGLEAVLKVV